jgi:hypothetical protein
VRSPWPGRNFPPRPRPNALGLYVRPCWEAKHGDTPLLDACAAYHVSETRHDSQPTSTEPTFYPVTKTLLSAILKEGRLPFEVRVNTSETKGKAHDMPDFVLGDDKMFVGVYGEVKRANVLLEDLALSTEQNDQIGRYLARRTAGFRFTGVRGGLFSASGSVPDKRR